MIRTGARWSNKPPLGTELDYTHPLAQGLVLAVAATEGNGATILDSALFQAQSTPGTLPGWAIERGALGPALDFGTTGREVRYAPSGPNPFSTQGDKFSIFARVYPTATATQTVAQCGGPGGSSGCLGLGLFTANQVLCFFGSNFSSGANSGVSVAANAWHSIGVAQSASNARNFFIDGQVVANAANNFGNPITPGPYVLGRNYNNTVVAGHDFQGRIECVYIWNRDIGVAGLAEIARSPYSLFATPRYRSWFVLGSPAFSYSPSGGLVFGGSAAPSVTYNPPASGGLILGGSAAPAVAFNPPASGGIVLGGSASPALAFNYIASGGVVFGGSATASSSSSFSYAASGGITLGGSASPVVSFAPVASGGLTLGGAAVPGVTFRPVASGGITFGGTATATLTGAQGFGPTYMPSVVIAMPGLPDPHRSQVQQLPGQPDPHRSRLTNL